MKPLNTNDPGCNYTTSNCVIWQGPDIPCISLCKGDTVSDVIFKLATELCEVLDILSITSYDLTCFNLTSCKPDDFQQLFQFLLERVCKLEQCTGCIPDCDGTTPTPSNPGGSASGCPDCIVPMAPCFYFTNPLGDLVTSMQLQDYVILIGNTICGNVGAISGQQKTLNNHEGRIVVLEEKTALPPVAVLPEITPVCVLPAVPEEMDVVLQALELQFCELRSATGLPNSLYQNIAKQAIGLNDSKALNGSGATMASLQGWSSIVTNLAQAIGNMQLTISDMRQAIQNIQLNCCPTGCDGIELTLAAKLSGDILTMYINGTIPAGFLQCSGNTVVKITDSQGGSSSFTFNLINLLNNPTGVQFSLTGTSLNTSLDLTLVIEPCLENSSTNSTCNSYLSYKVVNNANCPNVNYTLAQGSISYSFNSVVGDFTYTVELWDALAGTKLSSQVTLTNGVQTVSGQFTGLTPSTIYKVRVAINATSCPSCDPVVCPFSTLTTSPLPCPAPESPSGGISIP